MIDFKTPVLKRLKELAETNDHPNLTVTRLYADMLGKPMLGDTGNFNVWKRYPDGTDPDERHYIGTVYSGWSGKNNVHWTTWAWILGIFDEVVAAAEHR